MTEAIQNAYVVAWKAEPRQSGLTRYTVQFSDQREKAHAWETREDANGFYRGTLDGFDIKASAFGDRVCRNFRVEQRTANEFVIVCDYPRRHIAGSK